MTLRCINVYKSRTGHLVSFTRPQEAALKRAQEWGSSSYTLLAVESGKPTYSDAEIAELIRKHAKLTHIGVLHPDYRPADMIFGIRNPMRYEPDAVTMTFERAVECASKQFQCDVITISERDFEPGCVEVAEAWNVILLIV